MGTGRVEIMTCVGLPEALDKKRSAGFVEFDVRPLAPRGSVGRVVELWCDHTLRGRQECLDGAESLRVAADCLEQIATTTFGPSLDKAAKPAGARTRQPKRGGSGPLDGFGKAAPRKNRPAASKKRTKRVGRPKGSKTKRPRKPQLDSVSKHHADVIAGRKEP